jgi:phosphoglycolate phosphatase-like HAD superfamily hydrolase
MGVADSFALRGFRPTIGGVASSEKIPMLRIITDFDGPIMDVSERYYQVYLLCLQQTQQPGQAVTLLSKDEFWAMKRSQVPEAEIGRRSGLQPDQAQEFSQRRREQAHQLIHMQHDRLIPSALAALTAIQKSGIDLVVMTMRRDRELAYAFSQAPLAPFFPPERCYCLANDYIKTKDELDKPLLMARAVAELPPAERTWMIGDTEADIAAAHSQQIPIYGVLSGIRDRETLGKYQPEKIVADLQTAVTEILKIQ